MSMKKGSAKLVNIHALKNIPGADDQIHEEFRTQQALLAAQPTLVKRFLEAQARRLADAIHKNQMQISFTLPDKVVSAVSSDYKGPIAVVPAELREQWMGGVISRISRTDIRYVLRQRLSELEGASDPAVTASARLIRHVTALYMVHEMLPSGRTVIYTTGEGEEIPAFPVEDTQNPAPAITQASDAIVEEGPPFVPFALRFYLPQWVAFDENCHLLVRSIGEAEAYLASMQSFLGVLHTAIALAPYMMADPAYQQKRYGMLGQLIHQGRSLASYEVAEMIRVIKQRVAAHDLNRGLSLSMPYFDDQELEIHTRDFEVIPAGRIMFTPAFVVRAARQEQAKAAQDTRLSPSTRKYLLIELKAFEKAFYNPSKS
jgi:hypothetical protein